MPERRYLKHSVIRRSISETLSDTPCEVLSSFGTRHMFVNLTSKKMKTDDEKSEGKKNAFNVLMSARKQYCHLPEPRNPVNGKAELYNAVLQVLKSNSVGFTAMQVHSVGTAIASTLSNVLWYIDPHLPKFKGRGILIPSMFSGLSGFNDWQKHKQKQPLVNLEDLDMHASSLADMLMMPYFANSRFSYFKTAVEDLMKSLKDYMNFLRKQKQITFKNHHSHEPIRSLSDAWSMRTVHGAHSYLSSAYNEVYDVLRQAEKYEHIWLYPFEPADRIERRNWIEKMAFPFPVKVYTHHHGNYLGNFTFVWRIPEDVLDEDDVNVLAAIREDLPIFATSAMRKEFMERYASVIAIKPAVLRDMYRFLTQDSSAAETTSEAAVDDRVAQFLLNSDDTDLFYDLRRYNGRPKDEKLDPFWDELGKYLEETSAVHERRNGPHMYMPLAISLADLKRQILDRLPLDTPAPSLSWLRLNFWPMNPHCRTAVAYTGRFKVKYAVQQRLLRSKHADSGYAYHQFMMLKKMAVNMRKYASMLCLDNKSWSSCFDWCSCTQQIIDVQGYHSCSSRP